MSTTQHNNAQPTDAVLPLGGQPADASQFHGPHFICNMEGLVLDLLDEQGTHLKRNNVLPWLLQPGPQGTVAVTSLDDGMYLALHDRKCRTQATRDEPTVKKTPLYWQIVSTQGIYSLDTGEDKLALPLSPAACELWPVVSTMEKRKSVSLLILENTPEVRAALQIGNIGRWAYPARFAYYTIGEAGQIQIYNHLDSVIYAAVSNSQSSGSGGCNQRPVKPNDMQYWRRSSDENVHVSLGDCIEAQTAEVFQGRVGKVLHIQSLRTRTEWEGAIATQIPRAMQDCSFAIYLNHLYTGMKSVLPTDARYTVHQVAKAQDIGVKNNLKFNIYVIVFSSVEGGANSQYTMSPGKTKFWRRQGPEIVLVSVGGAPGAPRAFFGRIGFTLHVDRL
ncbi:hypothetical protein EST38_g10780 [Candolleomyces aberdarensis]|uniref:Uncharacterized protein n=1 Tax=Candolleomyces aberdarensis TaxID=2316362 RepID=A0A4Q2D846_9AGAR|nr:hypothetical protein EST38_g10780 [Candolleomyces aberdarensis]